MEHIFSANETFVENLANVGLVLQPKKSKCYIREGSREAEWDAARGGIPNRGLDDSQNDENAIFGITTCNIPIGSEAFVNECLKQKSAKIRHGFYIISCLLDPGRWPHPEIPSHQIMWILTAICLQFMGDYWLRHIRPDFTEEFAREV